MKTIILHILCEGQTEDRFVNDVLKEYLSAFNIVCKSQILLTNKQKNCRGGVLSYQQAKNDLTIMFKQFRDNENETHWFTTMFDLYKLPGDFPDYDKQFGDIYDRVNHLQQAFADDIANTRFIPYIQLHEYEALVFANLNYLEAEYPATPDLHRKIDILRKELETKQNNPELINTIKAPSKHIISALEGLHNYNKPKIGSAVAAKIGIPKLKEICKHFSTWINVLEQLK